MGLVLVVICALVVGIVAAQSQSKIAAAPLATAAPTPLPTPGTNQVLVVTNPTSGPAAVFAPSSIFVRPGDSVTWINLDTAAHSVTADDGSFTTVLSPRQRFSHRFTRGGVYTYSDFLHPDMHGAIEVVK